MAEIDKSIIQKVKDKLGVDIDDVFELFKLLRTKRASKHPDNFNDEVAKKIAHEEFTSLNSLYRDLNSYIQQRQASMVPIIADDSPSVIEFNHMMDIDGKNSEIEHLRRENESLNFNLKMEKEINDILHRQIEELSKQRIASIHDEIKSIYSPRKAWSGIGIAAILVSLVATFPVVKDFFNQIGATSEIALVAIQVLSIVTILKWIRSWAVNKIVENTEYRILNNPSINELLNIKPTIQRYGSSKECFFYESDIVSCINKMLILPYRILLYGGYDKTVKILTEDIVIQLDRKNLITRTESDGLNTVFITRKHSGADL